MTIKQLTGVWQLVAVEARRSTGERFQIFGKYPTGMLIYTDSGYMSVLVSDPDRPAFAGGNLFEGTPDELQAAFDGMSGYCGTFEVDEARTEINHHLLSSTFPGGEGTRLLRHYEFLDGRLIFKVPPTMVHGDESTVELIWERVG